MYRKSLIAGAVVAALAAAGCGSSATTTSTPTVAPKAPAKVQQTAAQSHSGMYNETALNDSVLASYNAAPGPKAKDANCIIAGQEAQCLLDMRLGTDTTTEDVTINAAGTDWVAHGV